METLYKNTLVLPSYCVQSIVLHANISKGLEPLGLGQGQALSNLCPHRNQQCAAS